MLTNKFNLPLLLQVWLAGDSYDYVNNPKNDGHIYFQLINLSPFDILLKKGNVIGQGIIHEYCITGNDNATGERKGGFGSTDGKIN